MRVQNVTIPPGYYKADGTKVNSTGVRPKNYKSQPNDVIVTPKGNINIYAESKSGISKFYPYYGGRSRLDISIRKSAAGKNVDYPEALHNHITAEKYQSTGGRKRRGYTSPPTENLVIRNGKWVPQAEAVTASKDIEKVIDKYWIKRNAPPDPYDFDGNKEAYDIAFKRYEQYKGHYDRLGGSKGIAYNDPTKPGNSNTKHYYRYVGGGWTHEMNNPNYQGIRVEGVIKENGKNRFVSLDKVFKNDPKGTLWMRDPNKAIELHKIDPEYTLPPSYVSPAPTSSVPTSPGRNGIKVNPVKTDTNNTTNDNNTTSSNVPLETGKEYAYSALTSKTAGKGTDSTDVEQYREAATTPWFRGQGSLKTRNDQTLAYWGSKYEGIGNTKNNDLARALRTGEAWETGKGTIIYQPSRGAMQVFKERKNVQQENPPPGEDNNIASTGKVQNNA